MAKQLYIDYIHRGPDTNGIDSSGTSHLSAEAAVQVRHDTSRCGIVKRGNGCGVAGTGRNPWGYPEVL